MKLVLGLILRKIPLGFLSRLLRILGTQLGFGYGVNHLTLEARTLLSLGNTDQESFVVFDIGANVGRYSEACLSLSGITTLVAFEPDSSNFQNLDSRLGSHDSVILVNKAVGNFTGNIELHSDKSGSQLSSLTKRKIPHTGLDFDFVQSVQIITVKDWLKTNSELKPDLIKIDVEGHEMDVLLGLEYYLEDVQAIQFEFGGCNIDTRTFFRDFWDFFSSSNFSLYRFTPRGICLIKEYGESLENFNTTVYFAVNNRFHPFASKENVRRIKGL
jgi:FkbM family methyltransferase